MKKIIFATKNENKLIEIRQIIKAPGYNIISMKEAGIDADIVEDGVTFEENALKKACELSRISGEICLSDDSGLEIDYLDKKPGVYSARFLGEKTPYTIKNAEILDMLKEVAPEKRTARFVCVIACSMPDGTSFYTKGTIEGTIAYEAKGSNGFGYDPIFYVAEYGMTTAEMPVELKNSISHRGKALRLMEEKLAKIL